MGTQYTQLLSRWSVILLIPIVCVAVLWPGGISLAEGDFVTCSGSLMDPCGVCHLLEALNRIMRFLIIILISVFFVLVAYAGFRLATGVGNPDVTKIIGVVVKNGVIGFVIVLSAWILVDTVLKILLDESEEIGVWNEITCTPNRTFSRTANVQFSESGLNNETPSVETQPANESPEPSQPPTENPQPEQPPTDNEPRDDSFESDIANNGEQCGEASVSGSPGNYSHTDRAGLADRIISNGDDAYGTTEITAGGQCLEVMNDSPTLPDGTYVPFTAKEAARMADEWGWQVPNKEEALAIRRYAEEQGNVYKGITRQNETGTERQNSISDLLNDQEMANRARQGRNELINGHFKWYVRENNKMKIMGLSSDGGSNYYQGVSGAHSSNECYVDYSHGTRLVRPCD